MTVSSLVNDLKEYLDGFSGDETEDIIYDFLDEQKTYYNVTNKEIDLIKELFFNYDPFEPYFIQRNRLDALDLFYEAMEGKYDS